MRILYVSTTFPKDELDWRGIFIFNQIKALAEHKDLELSLWVPPGKIPPITRYVASESERSRLSKLMTDGGIAHLLRNGKPGAILRILDLLKMLRALFRRERNIDLYHLNWIQTALALPVSGKPLLVTVLGADLKLLDLPLMKPMLRRVMRRRHVAICPNAGWMEIPLKKAFGDLADISPVYFGIDEFWYRVKRSLDVDKPCWLTVTRLTRNKLGSLLDWAKPVFKDRARQLHLFGPMQEEILLPDWIHYHGYATPKQLAFWFARSHGLITLSRHSEGRPQVILEAMAATLPVIASTISAHIDVISPGVTGELCANQAEFGHAIERLEDVCENNRFGNNCREWVLKQNGTWEDCAQRYLKIYNHLLE